MSAVRLVWRQSGLMYRYPLPPIPVAGIKPPPRIRGVEPDSCSPALALLPLMVGKVNVTNNAIYLVTIWAIPVIIAITFHEAAHGFVAYLLGDDTAWRLGRVSFNPLKHIR